MNSIVKKISNIESVRSRTHSAIIAQWELEVVRELCGDENMDTRGFWNFVENLPEVPEAVWDFGKVCDPWLCLEAELRGYIKGYVRAKQAAYERHGRS